MNKLNIDPKVKAFSEQDGAQSIVVHLKIDSKCFQYHQHPVSNRDNAKRHEYFRKEMDHLFASMKNSSILEYFSNISILKAQLCKEDLLSIFEMREITGIKAIEIKS